MLTLSGAPDHVVSWSDFLLQHIKSQKTKQNLSDNFFKLLQALSF